MLKIIKKTISLFMVLSMILACCACSDNSSSEVKHVDILSKDQVPNAKDLVPENFIDPQTAWSIYDDLIAQTETITDTAKRAELFHQAENILLSTYCILPLKNPGTYLLKKDYLEDVYIDNVSNIMLTKARLTNGSNTLRAYIAGEPDTLDPVLGQTFNEIDVCYQLYGALFRFDNETQNYEMMLAKDLNVSEDNLSYTVTLKDDIYWSDGSPITAYDFEYAWNRAINPLTAAWVEYFFASFDGYAEGKLNITVHDDKSFTFVLSAPCPYIKSLLANQAFFPMKQSVVESYKDYEKSPGRWCEESGFITSGAYIVSEWVHDSYMILEKNPYYVFADEVSIDKIELLLSNDSVTVFAAYNAGNLDLIKEIPSDEIKGVLDNPEFYIKAASGIDFVSINSHASIFEGKTPEEACCMRMAFALLINRAYICSNISPTSACPTTLYVPPNMSDGNGHAYREGYDEQLFDVYGMKNNPEETLALARMYLQAAGFEFDENGGKLKESTPLKFEITTRGSSILESIQQDLAVLGIETVLKFDDSTVYYENLRSGKYTMTANSWYADYEDVSCMLSIFVTDSSENYPCFSAGE